MKTFQLLYLSVKCFFLVFLFWATPNLGHGAFRIQITKPEVPLKEASSEYLTELNKMDEAFEKNELLDLYTAAFEFHEKMRKNLKTKDVEKDLARKKGEAIAREWWMWYVTNALPLPQTRLDFKKNNFPRENYRNFNYGIDIEMKAVVYGMLCNMIKPQNNVKIAKRLGKNPKELMERHIGQIRLIHRMFRYSLKKANEILEDTKKEDKLLAFHLGKSLPEVQILDDDECAAELRENGEEEDAEFILESKRLEPWRNLSYAENARKRKLLCEKNIKKLGERFLQSLLEVYPKDIQAIRLCLLFAGYETREEDARFLQEHIGRKAKYEHLYHGLPTERDLAEIAATERINFLANLYPNLPQSISSKIREMTEFDLSWIRDEKHDTESIVWTRNCFEKGFYCIFRAERDPEKLQKTFQEYLTNVKERVEDLRRQKTIPAEAMQHLEKRYAKFQNDFKTATCWLDMINAKSNFDTAIASIEVSQDRK